MVIDFCNYSPNSRCRPFSCLLAVLAIFLANVRLFIPRETNEMFSPFCIYYQKTVPRPQFFSVNSQ